MLAICGKLEQEIADLDPAEQKEFLQELGVQEPALNRFIAECFKLLGLIVFFTVGEDEVRAWTLPKDSKVVKAAGTIHTDLERGFIRAGDIYLSRLGRSQWLRSASIRAARSTTTGCGASCGRYRRYCCARSSRSYGCSPTCEGPFRPPQPQRRAVLMPDVLPPNSARGQERAEV